MAHRCYPVSGDYNSCSADDEDLVDRQYNDNRLQKAIRHLITEGSGDAVDLYLTRVQAIDEHILRNFVEQRKSFDPRLYRQLQYPVQEVQSDVQDVNEEASLQVDSNSSVGALYRANDDDFDGRSSIEMLYTTTYNSDECIGSSAPPETASNLTSGKRVSLTDEERTSEDEDVREKCFLYGGPNNDPERWYKELPPILPFGENPYMEKWESMKINYDLIESAKRTGDDAKLVSTNVPYDHVVSNGGFMVRDKYDSGSRFKLPKNLSNHWSGPKLWPEIIGAFNAGGPLQHEKNYAPRLILPPVSDIKITSVKVPAGTSNTQAQRGKSDITTYGNTCRHPSTRSTVLGKFASRREAAAHRDKMKDPATYEKVGPMSRAVSRSRQLSDDVARRPDLIGLPKIRPKILTSATQSKSKPSTVQGSAGVPAEPPKRKRGRPRKNPDLSYHPPRRPSADEDQPTTPVREEIEDLYDTAPPAPRGVRPHKTTADRSYRPSQSPLTPTKRKGDLDMDDDEPIKKPRVTRKKYSVDFAGKELELVTKATPSKKTTPKKSAIKKSTRISTEERDLLDAAKALSPIRRGKTRSGGEYKPLRLRSIDKSKK